MPLKPETIAHVTKFNNQIFDLLANLYERWQDEKEYEDIADYLKPFAAPAKEFSITLNKMTKKPFGFQCSYDGHTFHVFMKNKGRNRWTWGTTIVK